MNRWVPVLVVAALAVAACAPQAGASPGGGLRGSVTAGPTCAVVQDPPDPDCADRPVAGAVLVIIGPDGAEVAQVTTDEAGEYQVTLAPGRYRVVPQSVAGLMGTAPESEAVVASGRFTELAVAYDTGIR